MQVDGDCCQLSSSGDDGEDVGGYSKDRYTFAVHEAVVRFRELIWQRLGPRKRPSGENQGGNCPHRKGSGLSF